MRQILGLFIGLLMITSSYFAQEDVQEGIIVNENSYMRIKSKAKHALMMGDAYLAMACYEKMVGMKPDNLKDVHQLAELYRVARDYKNAEKHYFHVCTKARERFPSAVFYLGQMKKANGKWDEARADFDWVLRNYREYNLTKFKKLAKSELAGCDVARKLVDTNNMAIINHLDTSINNPHIEFSPIPVNEKALLYGSLKEETVKTYDKKKLLEDSIKTPIRKLYMAKKDGDKWVYDYELEIPINPEDREYEVGNANLSPDGNRLYFTKCTKNEMHKVICKIYYSEKDGDSWGEPEEIKGVNMPGYTSTQPTIGRESKKDREVLYFVSNRPGGKGGLDIWYSIFDPRKNYFKSPKNAGKSINTEGTEMTPNYNLTTKTMYFSSDGHPNIGMLDVFYTDGETKKWKPAKNKGIPINSSADDLYYVVEDGGASGFFTSNREGGEAFMHSTCCDDIYSFKLKEFIEILFVGKVVDKVTGKCLQDYDMNMYIIDDSTKKRFLSKVVHFDSCNFKVRVEAGLNYEVVAEKDGYLKNSTSFTTKGIEESDTIYGKIPLERISNQPFVLRGILYPFDDHKLTDDAKKVIDTSLYPIMLDNPDIKIRLSSHTDSKGSEHYNERLSQKRAESVVDYLIEKGINPNQLVAKGYGEAKPIAPNQNDDGSDNPEGRKLNRRTEFEIIGKLTIEEMYGEDEEDEDGVKVKKFQVKKPKKQAVKKPVQF